MAQPCGVDLFQYHSAPVLPTLADEPVMNKKSISTALNDKIILQEFKPLLEGFLNDEYANVQLRILYKTQLRYPPSGQDGCRRRIDPLYDQVFELACEGGGVRVVTPSRRGEGCRVLRGAFVGAVDEVAFRSGCDCAVGVYEGYAQASVRCGRGVDREEDLSPLRQDI